MGGADAPSDDGAPGGRGRDREGEAAGEGPGAPVVDQPKVGRGVALRRPVAVREDDQLPVGPGPGEGFGELCLGAAALVTAGASIQSKPTAEAAYPVRGLECAYRVVWPVNVMPSVTSANAS